MHGPSDVVELPARHMRLPARLNTTRQASGFTVVEILVSVVIALVIAALVLVPLTKAKDRGLATDDLARLRHLGQAAAIYEEQHETLPFACAQLAQAGLAPSLLCAGTADPVPQGTGAARDHFALKESDFPTPGSKLRSWDSPMSASGPARRGGSWGAKAIIASSKQAMVSAGTWITNGSTTALALLVGLTQQVASLEDLIADSWRMGPLSCGGSAGST